MKQLILVIMLTFIGLSTAYAQVGIGTTSPDASAILDLTSTTQGLLPPRMTADQRDDDIDSPAQGLMMYCTNCGANGEIQFYNGAAWVNVVGGVAAVPFDCGDSVTFTYNGSSVTYGTVLNTTTAKCWLDRNLGATQVAAGSTDTASYGDLFQWGRGDDGHQIRSPLSSTTPGPSSSPSPGANFLTGGSIWYSGSSPHPDTLWQGVNGTNNPCPSGYRLPTLTEWDNERLSWVQAPINSSNNSQGALASPLKLPNAGYRSNGGSTTGLGTNVYYWGGTFGDINNSRSLAVDGNSAAMGTHPRVLGFSVRCIKD